MRKGPEDVRDAGLDGAFLTVGLGRAQLALANAKLVRPKPRPMEVRYC